MSHRFAPLSMPRLVQAVRLDQLAADEQHQWRQAARALPKAALSADPAGWPAYRLLAHLLTLHRSNVA